MESLSKVFRAVTGSTAISAMVAVISLWVVWAERADKTLAWKAGCAMAVLGVLGIVFTIREELASQAEASKAASDLRESQEKVAELLGVNKRMAMQLASRGDILTYEARNRLLERLKALPPKSVWLMRVNPNPESGEFSDIIEDLLTEAGCLAGRSLTREVSTNRNAPGRVVIQRQNQSPNFAAVAKALASALGDAGIPDVTVDENVPLIGGAGGDVLLTIKPK